MLRFYFFTSVFIVCFPFFSFGKIHYVNHAATGLDNGTSWQNAFKSPIDALKIATEGDEIWIAKGEYNAYRGAQQNNFRLKSGVALYGGFAGTETTLNQRDFSKNQTILKSYFVLQNGDSLRLNVMFCQNTNKNTLIDGLIISRGLAVPRSASLECSDSTLSDCHGGGVYIYSSLVSQPSSLQIRNCTFLDNAGEYGGGVSINFVKGTGTVIVKNCRFERNGYDAGGGSGLYAVSGPFGKPYIEIDSCIFRKNRGRIGGGMSISDIGDNNGQYIVRNCLFEQNKVLLFAAGAQVQNYLGTKKDKISIENCHFVDNVAYSPIYPRSGQGGGLDVYGGTVRNCIFEGNISSRGGAITGGYYDLFNNIISNNRVYLNGGALRGHGDLNVVGNTFINNKANDKGGIFTPVARSKCNFINNIFWGNKGLNGTNLLDSLTGCRFYFANCAIDMPDCASLSKGTDPKYDTIVCGSNLYFNLEPYFRDTANGDYRLSTCSPLLDLGNSDWLEQFGIETDFSGNPRVKGEAPDLGAYEIEASLPTPVLQTQDASTATASNGSALVFSITGGVPPYRYLWSNGQTNDRLTDVLPGLYGLSVTDRYDCRGEASVRISYTSAAHTATDAAENRIFPNPANGRFWVKTKEMPQSVSLFDLNGSLLRRFEGADIVPAGMEISGLPAGMYRVAVQMKDGAVWQWPLAVVR
jgi:hypothetical protein